WGYTPLMEAARTGQTGIARLLLGLGADTNLPCRNAINLPYRNADFTPPWVATLAPFVFSSIRVRTWSTDVLG
ncbi:hypothetical protein, partial [Thiolapillus sp.]